MIITHWLSNNYIEVFGAVTGIIFVFLEIRQTIWLWLVGIITSAVYIWVFFTSKIYADMSLQVYYLVISCLGWYWWAKGAGRQPSLKLRLAKQGTGQKEEGVKEMVVKWEKEELEVTRLKLRTGVILAFIFILLYIT